MKKRIFFRLVAFVLLFAIQWAILPFSLVFHKHHGTASVEKQGLTTLKKHEKPCCHAFEVTLDAVVPALFRFAFEEPIFSSYSDYSNPEFSNLFVSFSNKAPPVKKV